MEIHWSHCCCVWDGEYNLEDADTIGVFTSDDIDQCIFIATLEIAAWILLRLQKSESSLIFLISDLRP